MTDRDQLALNLKEWIATVSFEKKDGTIRELRCTLNSKYLPEVIVEETEEVKKTRKKNDNVLSVWDLENEGWRSFRIDSVKYIRYEEAV